MNQQKLVKRFRERVTDYLKSLCSASDSAEVNSREGQEPIEHKPVPRRKRLNFILNRGLIKVTRKNIVLEEFQAQASMLRLPPALERHIATRIAKATVVVLHGNFTDEAAKTVPFALRVITKQPSLRAKGNAVLAKGRLPIRTEPGCIDVFAHEIKTSPIQAMEHAIAAQQISANSHLFVSHEQIAPEQLSSLFAKLQGRQMIEVERAMVLDKCIATLVYISPCSQFLHINAESLIQFLAYELGKASPYAEKFQLQAILMPLLEKGFFAEVASTTARLIESGRVEKGFEKEFLREIQQEYPHTAHTAKECRFSERTEPQTSIEEGTLNDKTPLFGVRPRNSTFQHSLCEEQERKRRSSANFNTLQGIGTSMEIYRT